MSVCLSVCLSAVPRKMQMYMYMIITYVYIPRGWREFANVVLSLPSRPAVNAVIRELYALVSSGKLSSAKQGLFSG